MDGYSHLAENGIIHRGLNINNIFIGLDHKIKIGDLLLSKRIDD